MGEFARQDESSKAVDRTWELAKQLPRPGPAQPAAVDPAAHYARIAELKKLIEHARSQRDVIGVEWRKLCGLLAGHCESSEQIIRLYNHIVGDLLLPNPMLRSSVSEATAGFDDLLKKALQDFEPIRGWGFDCSLKVVPLRSRKAGGKDNG